MASSRKCDLMFSYFLIFVEIAIFYFFDFCWALGSAIFYIFDAYPLLEHKNWKKKHVFKIFLRKSVGTEGKKWSFKPVKSTSLHKTTPSTALERLHKVFVWWAGLVRMSIFSYFSQNFDGFCLMHFGVKSHTFQQN